MNQQTVLNSALTLVAERAEHAVVLDLAGRNGQ
jgi:hypothetical protein